MARVQGGYGGNSPSNNTVIRPGIYNSAEHYSLAQKGQWPDNYNTLTFSYILKDLTPNTATRSFSSGSIVLAREKYTYITVFGGPSEFLNLVPTASAWDQPPSPPRPKAAIWYRYKKPVNVQVTAVNASGTITGYNIDKGKGIRTSKVNTSVTLSGGAGSGATAILNRDVDNLTSITLTSGGLNYTVGDVLSWTDTLDMDGTQSTVDEFWDILIHGVGGDGLIGDREDGRNTTAFQGLAPITTGSNPGAAHSDGGSWPGMTIAGGTASNKPWFTHGATRAPLYTDATWEYSKAGAGGSGWGGGSVGSTLNNTGANQQSGANGGSGYSTYNTTLVTSGVATTTNYGTSGMVELQVDGLTLPVNTQLTYAIPT